MTLQDIQKEADQAGEKYGPFNSTHEAAAVLREEFEEFWELVKMSKQDGEKSAHMIHELKQIAAVAYRTAKEIEENKIRWI